MFLIRVTFWLALIVLLLPTDKSAQERLYTAASETAHRVATFCDRNAQVCARGSEYWAVFKQKLDFGAKLAYEIASERLMGKSAPAADPVNTSAIAARQGWSAPREPCRRPTCSRNGAESPRKAGHKSYLTAGAIGGLPTFGTVQRLRKAAEPAK